MRSHPPTGVQVVAVEDETRAASLDLVFQFLAGPERIRQVEQLLAAAARGEADFSGLFALQEKDRLVGAIWAQSQPGRTVSIWPPQVLAEASGAHASLLLAEAVRYASAQGARLAQVLLTIDAGETADLFSRAGFRHFADLLYLVSLDIDFPTTRPVTDLQFEPHAVAEESRLARIIMKTYEQSRDCPALGGVRTIEDVLAGYRAAGAFDPSRWLIVRHSDRDVGCLLLADHAESDQWELVYVGLVPEARGRGWGVEITRQAQWLTRQAGRPRLTLAVDAANEPAIDMYAQAGFYSWDKRSVWLRVL